MIGNADQNRYKTIYSGHTELSTKIPTLSSTVRVNAMDSPYAVTKSRRFQLEVSRPIVTTLQARYQDKSRIHVPRSLEVPTRRCVANQVEMFKLNTKNLGPSISMGVETQNGSLYCSAEGV